MHVRPDTPRTVQKSDRDEFTRDAASHILVNDSRARAARASVIVPCRSPGVMRDAPPRRVLLVEDHEADVMLTREALAHTGIVADVHIVRNGLDALRVLQDGGHQLPELILLDINMPFLDGFETLHAIKQDAVLKRIPIVMLTTSGAVRDANRAYDLGANAFVTKPVSFEAYIRVVDGLLRFWLTQAVLPSEPRSDFR